MSSVQQGHKINSQQYTCLCKDKTPKLITTSQDEIVCCKCGVVFGYYQDNESNDVDTIPSCHITNSSHINLFQRRQTGSNPFDSKKIIKFKRLNVDADGTILASFSTICDKLNLPPIVAEQCYRLYQKISKRYARFTRAKSVCLAIYLVCRKNMIPYDEQNVCNIVRYTLGVKNAPKFKSVIFKINKESLGLDCIPSENDEIGRFYSAMSQNSKSKEQFYLNLHISQAQKNQKIKDIFVLKSLASQYYDELLSNSYENNTDTNETIDYDTKAKRAVSLALQRCIAA